MQKGGWVLLRRLTALQDDALFGPVPFERGEWHLSKEIAGIWSSSPLKHQQSNSVML